MNKFLLSCAVLVGMTLRPPILSAQTETPYADSPTPAPQVIQVDVAAPPAAPVINVDVEAPPAPQVNVQLPAPAAPHINVQVPSQPTERVNSATKETTVTKIVTTSSNDGLYFAIGAVIILASTVTFFALARNQQSS